jgi:hypothetical protein
LTILSACGKISLKLRAIRQKGNYQMLDINSDKLQEVIQGAFDKATGSRRWQTGIVKAKQQIESNPYLHMGGDALLILSPSNEIYRANGTCQCKAFTLGQPCWHRAAARLVKRYNETSH